MAGSQIGQEVGTWSGVIAHALAGAASSAGSSGAAIGAAFAAGIESSTYRVQAAAINLAAAAKAVLPHSPAPDPNSPFNATGWHQVKTSGMAVADQFADGLDQGTPGVVAAAQKLAQQVKDATAGGGALNPQLSADVAKETSAIGIQLDKLKVQRDALGKKDPARKDLEAQMDQLRSLKDELGLDSKESKYSDKYGGGKNGKGGDSMQEAASMITTALAQGLDAMKGFAMANVSQLEGDLGMSGHGAVEELGNYGLSFLSNAANGLAQYAFGGVGGADGKSKSDKGGNTYNFHSTDDTAMRQQYEHVQQRESMQYTQRSNV